VSDDPTRNETGAAPAPAGPKEGWSDLGAWLEANRAGFTDEALTAAATGAGWDASAVEAQLKRLRAREGVAPLRSRARLVIGILYLGGFLVLTAGMLVSPNGRAYGASVIGVIVLLISLAIAYVLGRLWVDHIAAPRSMAAVGLVILLSLPVILWVAVTGLCVATGLPVPTA
jgi:hypothetical protein